MNRTEMIGQRIKEIRTQKSITQLQLAKKIGIKAYQTIASWESDAKNITLEYLIKITDALNVPFESLFFQQSNGSKKYIMSYMFQTCNLVKADRIEKTIDMNERLFDLDDDTFELAIKLIEQQADIAKLINKVYRKGYIEAAAKCGYIQGEKEGYDEGAATFKDELYATLRENIEDEYNGDTPDLDYENPDDAYNEAYTCGFTDGSDEGYSDAKRNYETSCADWDDL